MPEGVFVSKKVLLAISAILIGLGVYLFPLGQDVFLFGLEDIAGGNRVYAAYYAYTITLAFLIIPGIIVAWHLKNKKPFRNPWIAGFVIGCIMVAGAFIIVMARMGQLPS